MRTEIITCDGPCGAQISVVHSLAGVPGDYCWEDLQKLMAPQEEACAHEENASDAVPGRATARLVCKACGYDRVEEVA